MRRRDCVGRWKARGIKGCRFRLLRRPDQGCLPRLGKSGEMGTFLPMLTMINHNFCGFTGGRDQVRYVV